MSAMAAEESGAFPKPKSRANILARFFAAVLDCYGASFKALADYERRTHNGPRG
jgi:hypothetical protein